MAKVSKKNTKSPLVSIITVVRNAENTIERSIKSIINQSYDNYEYIIIDGNSTDETLKIINKYKKYIRLLSEPDDGIYDALNKGIEISKGTYYLVVGADDILYENSLSRVVNNHLIYRKADFVACSMHLGNKLKSGIKPNLGIFGAGYMLPGHSVGLFIKKEVHTILGMYSKKFKIASDALFIKKLFNSNFKGESSRVLMGKFSLNGVSNGNILDNLLEGYLVQLETEKSKKIQTLLFILRLLKNISKI